MLKQAKGTFEVKLNPQVETENIDESLGRMRIDKQLHGDLEGTSKGQMLTAGTSTKNSGAYVAVEKVTGTLHGRNGSFILHHRATMTRGTPHLEIQVVPDSGTDQLAGLAGDFKINIVEGKHFYEFDYTISDNN
jgi:hypothetical protein